MKHGSDHIQLGVAACSLALFLIFIGIPNAVSSPSNVRNIVLAPTFWPYVLSAIAGLTGLGLLISGWHQKQVAQADTESTSNAFAWFRLAVLAVIMVITMYALPRLGMVWTTMLVFLVTAFLFNTRHPKIALLCAILIPLGLYLFFAHVAGVGIPQGNYVRLP